MKFGLVSYTILLCLHPHPPFYKCVLYHVSVVDCVWNVMAHAQKPDFVFRLKGRVHLNLQGGSVQWNTGNRVVRISSSNAGYTMFRGSVKSTAYPIHLPVSPSLPLPCITLCHHISAGLYSWCWTRGLLVSPRLSSCHPVDGGSRFSWHPFQVTALIVSFLTI